MSIRHVRWCFNIKKWTPTKEQWLKLITSIPEDELIRINRFVYKEDSESSLIGQALILKFLNQVLNVNSNELNLARTELGRPQLCPAYLEKISAENGSLPKVMDFNVSHSGDFCVLAGLYSVNTNFPNELPDMTIGVDVTQIVKKKNRQELTRFLDLMSRREFLPSEWETVERVPDDRQKCINFTRLWCLKECFIKSIGLGLRFKLRRIQFQFDEHNRYCLSVSNLKTKLLSDTRVLLDHQLANDWKFLETALDDEHLVAIGYHQLGDDCDNQIELDERNLFKELSIDLILDKLTPRIEAGLIEEENWLKFCQKSTKDHYNARKFDV